MPASVETLSNARSYLPNTFTDVTAREIDFVTRFGNNWQALRDIIGISRPIRKAAGTKLVTRTASVTLQDGDVDPGNVIPYSSATVVQTEVEELTVLKYAKAATLEDVVAYGADVAVAKTDEAFLNELQAVVLSNFYTFLNTGALTDTQSTFQMALAMAKAEVVDKFQQMRKNVTEVVGFCNILDAYEYLGAANISTQTAHGLTYIKDFMGYSTLFLCSDPDIAQGTVIATPVENIMLYYVDPSDSDFAKLGLTYTVAGDTNLIGFHAEGNYNTAVGASFAIMGMALLAEYIDGIAVITIGEGEGEGD